MRRVWAIAVSVAVQAAALGAPFVHAHPDDHTTDHHDGRTIHTHWTGHAHEQHENDVPVLTDADHDRAVFLNGFVAVKSAPSPTPFQIIGTHELPAPAEQRPYRVIDVVRSHDPPIAASRPSRAPPSFLS